jgi:hypothetical protein
VLRRLRWRRQALEDGPLVRVAALCVALCVAAVVSVSGG